MADIIISVGVVFLLCSLLFIYLLGKAGESGECSMCGEYGSTKPYWSDDSVIFYICEKSDCIQNALASGYKK